MDQAAFFYVPGLGERNLKRAIIGVGVRARMMEANCF